MLFNHSIPTPILPWKRLCEFPHRGCIIFHRAALCLLRLHYIPQGLYYASHIGYKCLFCLGHPVNRSVKGTLQARSFCVQDCILLYRIYYLSIYTHIDKGRNAMISRIDLPMINNYLFGMN